MVERKEVKEELSKRFLRVLQNSSQLGGNPFLARLRPLLDEVAAMEDDQISGSIERLYRLVGDADMGLDEAATEEFVQELGEAHFYVLCTKCGINLEKLPTGDDKTPDFRYAGASDVWLEVKTPSVDRGKERVKASIEESFEGRVELERQLAAGRRVAMTEQVIAPYGHVEHSQRLTNVVGMLQKKLRNNLKAGQFSNKPTYLVCSLMMLQLYGSGNEALRPVYANRFRRKYVCPVSGELWMVAFSEPGMLVFSEPEFAGKPGIEGQNEQHGILVDQEYDYVAGILFAAYDLGGSPRMLGLVRSDEDLVPPMLELVGTSWNDGGDSNGWAL